MKTLQFSARPTGFQITFENGLTLSTQFGPANYCENHSLHVQMHYGPFDVTTSATAEIAVIDEETGNFVTKRFIPELENDDVKGWINVTEWYEILSRVANYKR